MNVCCRVYRLFGTFSRVPKIAVVGSGPAGMYCCSGVLRRLPSCKIDVFEANTLPYGLVRYGVAPDHPEVKNCIKQFDKLFSTYHNRLTLYCNVRIGDDITFDELLPNYDAVVLAYGAGKQKSLKIPGVNAKNVFSGADFVHWYNGYPGSKVPSLDVKNVVVIGIGNVALDCCRILLCKPNEHLSNTNMPETAVKLLERSHIQKVTIVGRRGPLEASFTTKELREQIKLPGCSFAAEIDAIDHNAIQMSLPTLKRPKRRLIELLLKNASTAVSQPRHCQILFRRTPNEVRSNSEGAVEGVVFKNERTKSNDILPCGLLIYCLGYENTILNGIPRNNSGQLDMIDEVRVNLSGGVTGTSVYATGWCSHSPRGVIAQTQIESANVSAALCKDLEESGTSKALLNTLPKLLQQRHIRYTLWNHPEF